MESKGIFPAAHTILGKAMDLRARKHNLIASNISNMDTPGYKGFDLVVEEELQKVMGDSKNIKLEKTDPKHLSAGERAMDDIEYKVEESSQYNQRGDGNTVDIDREMTKMSENSLLYNASARILSKKFQILKSVIRGGR